MCVECVLYVNAKYFSISMPMNKKTMQLKWPKNTQTEKDIETIFPWVHHFLWKLYTEKYFAFWSFILSSLNKNQQQLQQQQKKTSQSQCGFNGRACHASPNAIRYLSSWWTIIKTHSHFHSMTKLLAVCRYMQHDSPLKCFLPCIKHSCCVT